MPSDIINSFLTSLNSKVKKHTSVELGESLRLASHVPFGIPSGLPQLDLSLGRPGLPAGRIVEYYGYEMSGKTTAGFHAIASAQKLGGVGLFIDAENSLDKEMAAKIGVDVSNLLVAEVDDMETIFSVIDAFVETVSEEEMDKPMVVVVDSVTAVSTKEEMEKDHGDSYKIGSEAFTIRRSVRRLNKKIAEANVTVIFINHSVEKVNTRNPFGKSSDSSGGRAIKYFASIRVPFTFMSTITEGQDEAKKRKGQKCSAKLEKNKVAETGKPMWTMSRTENGFDLYLGVRDALITAGGIKKNGAMYTFVATGDKVRAQDWRRYVDKNFGDAWNLYMWFLEQVELKGLVKPYGVRNDPNIRPDVDVEKEGPDVDE
jgi:recombination protein RecA